jgi:mannose-6-phosphate isomerase-like protein (cupin superfamily)
MEVFFAGPDEGEIVEREHGRLRFLAELPDLEVLDQTYEFGWEGVAPHSHDDHTDSFYVVEGEVEFLVGGEWRRGGPGTFVAIPPGVVHGFRNPGPGHIRVLNVHAPKVGFNDRIRNS